MKTNKTKQKTLTEQVSIWEGESGWKKEAEDDIDSRGQ